MTKLAGLAVGLGLRANLGEAYTFLMREYQQGDKLFVFGFSRGAYTARALAGLLHAAGLLRPGSEQLVSYAVNVYARSKDWSDDDWKQMHRFAGAFSRKVDGKTSVPVDFMGVWDSVKAAGVLRWNLRWLYTRQVPNVRVVRHAVSIDEKRRPYHEYLISALDKEPRPAVDEVWFAGVHSDVGGTFEDDPRLPAITLKWMVEGAVDAGLVLKKNAYANSCTVTDDNALGTVHRMGWVWGLLRIDSARSRRTRGSTKAFGTGSPSGPTMGRRFRPPSPMRTSTGQGSSTRRAYIECAGGWVTGTGRQAPVETIGLLAQRSGQRFAARCNNAWSGRRAHRSCRRNLCVRHSASSY